MDHIPVLRTTPTIEAQRDVELMLLQFLRKYNPEVYFLWCSHPDMEPCMEAQDANGHEGSSVTAPDFNAPVPLLRRLHVEYLSRQLGSLPSSSQGLYSSRPWLAYWSLQAADVLGVTDTLLELTPAEGLVQLLMSCLVVSDSPHYLTQCTASKAADAVATGCSSAEAGTVRSRPKPSIGFAGGPVHQMAHVVTAYAAVSALALLNSFYPCLHRLPRAAIKRWLLSLRTPSGGFCVHPGGERDVRASYAASVITTLLRLDDPKTFPKGITSEVDGLNADNKAFNDCRGVYEKLGITEENGFDLSGYSDIRDTPVLNQEAACYVAHIQTHEGGFTCDALSSEAHGAYTQCALASLLLMKQPQMAQQSRVRRWLAERQLSYEGGFNGRTNKLVDSCYSHWVGSSHIMVEASEKYSKLLGSDTRSRRDRHEQEEEKRATALEAASEDANSCVLLAKDMFLLDHVQLVDISMAVCLDNDAWDRAETAELTKQDLLEQFLSADDSTRRQSTSHCATKRELLEKLFAQGGADTAGESPTEDSTEEKMVQLNKDVAFARAAVGDYHFNQRKLQQYVLRCCQCWQDGEGGLMDKPECNNDAYHTCYSLSGMSGAQNLHYMTHAANPGKSPYIERAMEGKHYVPGRKDGYGVVLGVEGPSVGAEVSVLRSTNPIFNLHRSRVVNAMRTWGAASFL